MGRKTTGTIFKRGKIYWLKWTFEGLRHQISLDTKSKGAAEKKAKEKLLPFLAQDAATTARLLSDTARSAEDTAAAIQEQLRPRLLIADAWQLYEDDPTRPECKEISLSDNRNRWNKFTAWATAKPPAGPGLVNMEDVTQDHASLFTKTLTGLSGNRFNKIRQQCQLMFHTLAPRCANMVNPFERIARKRLTPRGRRELSEAELRVVCGAAEGELRTLLGIGLMTGMRLHDACCLQWESVNLNRNIISIIPHKTERSGKAIVIPIHPELRGLLSETPLEKRQGDVLPEAADQYRKDKSSLCKRIREHFENCEIQTQERNGKGRAVTTVGFHSMRHSFVSLSAAAGVPLPVIQALVGHSNPQIQRLYLHIGETQARDAVNSLPAVWTEHKALPAATSDLDGIREKVIELAKTAPAETLRKALRLFEKANESKEQ